MIQFDYNAVSTNIQNGDTVTISGSEVYEVITGSYDTNDGGRTKGILFCARNLFDGDYSLNNLTTAVDGTISVYGQETLVHQLNLQLFNQPMELFPLVKL